MLGLKDEDLNEKLIGSGRYLTAHTMKYEDNDVLIFISEDDELYVLKSMAGLRLTKDPVLLLPIMISARLWPMRKPVLRFRKSGRLTEKYPCGVKSYAMVLAMDFTSQSPSAVKITANKYSQPSMRLFLLGEVPKHLEWIL